MSPRWHLYIETSLWRFWRVVKFCALFCSCIYICTHIYNTIHRYAFKYLIFHLPYFHASNSALFLSSTQILFFHRSILDSFYVTYDAMFMILFNTHCSASRWGTYALDCGTIVYTKPRFSHPKAIRPRGLPLNTTRHIRTPGAWINIKIVFLHIVISIIKVFLSWES